MLNLRIGGGRFFIYITMKFILYAGTKSRWKILTNVPNVPAAFITLSESSNVSMLVKSVKIFEVSPFLLDVRDITRKHPNSLSARVPRMYAAFPATLKLKFSLFTNVFQDLQILRI